MNVLILLRSDILHMYLVSNCKYCISTIQRCIHTTVCKLKPSALILRSLSLCFLCQGICQLWLVLMAYAVVWMDHKANEKLILGEKIKMIHKCDCYICYFMNIILCQCFELDKWTVKLKYYAGS